MILSDVREALSKVRRFVTSKSAFFNAFIQESLRFSSCLYLYLIWICTLRHVFENPKEAVEYLKSHPFFKEFVSSPSTDAYIDALCNSLQSICIGSPVKQSIEKCWLSEMLLGKGSSDEETAHEETPRKKSRVTWGSELEDDPLPETSSMTVAEVLGRASSSKKKYRARAKLYSEPEDDALPTAPTMTVEEVADIASPPKKKRKQKKAKKD